MLSFWERESLVQYQYIIIGCGIVGLSTAASILEHEPQAEILILEKGLLRTGASTKNAGFACFGSLTEMIADLKIISPVELKNLVEKRWEGLGRLRYRLGDVQIGFENNGGYELIFDNQNISDQELQKVNDLIFPLFGKNVFQKRPDLVKPMGFDSNKISYLIENPFEGQIDTGKMMKALIRYVTSKGATILTGADVKDISETKNGVNVQVGTQDGLEFIGEKVAICTNAFTCAIIPELDVIPGRGQVIITKPIKNLALKGVFHYEDGYFYFRNVGNRVLIGGGRNRDIETETTSEFGSNDKLIDILKNHLEEFILPNQTFEIDMAWSGIMAFGTQRNPIIKKISDRVFAGVRMNGMGIAIGSSIGEEVATMLIS